MSAASNSSSEKPILFSAPMVRAILEGRKSQTRRIVKSAPHHWPDAYVLGCHKKTWGIHESVDKDDAEVWRGRSPYAVGDVRWLRETWAAPHAYDHLPPRLIPQDANIHYAATEDLGGLLKRQSIYLPRWAARLFLRVTHVRVERLQEISEADAIAEGVSPYDIGEIDNASIILLDAPLLERPHPHRNGFALLWDSLNAKRGYGWDTNPFVWVITFERML